MTENDLISVREGLRDPRSGLFDEQYYCEANPNVGTGEISPLAHYLSVGAFEGRRPNRLFDSAYYLSTYPDVAHRLLKILAYLFGLPLIRFAPLRSSCLRAIGINGRRL